MTSQSTTPTDLEREIEETRQRLAATIDELAHRAHPKNIVQREVATVKAHFVDPVTGETNTANVLKVAGAVVGVAVLFVTLRKLSK